ncbi:endophilin-a [Anaeramoeba flamelloides]|uniref:Endophilin-a n=1 Tax=Anaeramoeba flamelloides TaxID=1746091 RepID=A0ABQ8ZCD9_9EUKA|nr:endophilin-a [Anaeramoeba flamelloides]
MTNRYLKVVFEYLPTENDELELSVDEIIRFVKEIEDGWYYGENIKTKKNGAFPSNYVEETDYQPKPKPKPKPQTRTQTKPQTESQQPSDYIDPQAFMVQSKLEIKEQTSNIPKSQIVKEGWLVKKGEKFKNWKKRYFKLYSRSLKYHKTPTDFVPLGTVLLQDAVVEKSPKKRKKGLFTIQTPNRLWHFKAVGEIERQGWYVAISRQISILDEEAKKISDLKTPIKKNVTTIKTQNTQQAMKKKTPPKPITKKLPPKPTPKKSIPNNQDLQQKPTNIFGVPLNVVLKRNNSDVPEIVQQTTKYLIKNVNSEIFVVSGKQKNIIPYKLKYDRGQSVTFENENNPLNISELLIDWIIELPDTLLPKALIPKLFETINQKENKERMVSIHSFVEQISEEIKTLLHSIFDFLDRLIKLLKSKKIPETSMIKIFAASLFLKKKYNERTKINEEYLKLVKVMIQFNDYLFSNGELEWKQSNVQKKNKKNQKKGNDNDNSKNQIQKKAKNNGNNLKTIQGYKILFKATALYKFVPDGESPDDLPINKGDVLSIISTEDEDWWYGTVIKHATKKKLDNALGYFPSTYVKKMSQDNWEKMNEN